MKERGGFTVIELLIVISLITLFSFLTAPFSIEFYREQTLDEEAQFLANNLKNTQSHAMAGKDDIAWGVEFLSEKYIIFKGGSCGEGTTHRTVNLRGGVELEGDSCVLFKGGTGVPNNSAEVTIKHGEERSYIINITEGGAISIVR